MEMLGGRVLVEMDEVPYELASGLLLDQYALPKATKGTVAAVAQGEIQLAVGDRVLLHPHTGEWIKIAEKDYKIVYSGDVLGVLCEPGKPT